HRPMSTVGLKLGSLVIRTISKPIATAIKAQARDHPTFRRICIRLAQSLHRTDMQIHPTTTYTVNGRTYHIRPLSETKAIDRGAAFISEFFLFAVAGSLILFESLRSRRKETNRQDIVTERLERLEEHTRQDEARMAILEDEVWRLRGGKGPRPK
ncbi:optic atrophy 3 protein-domain-containing protein, partial [Terfezia claveryi]